MENNQGLRPSPDFKVNDRVTCEGNTGLVVSILQASQFPIQALFDGGGCTFTSDGRYTKGGDVVLFRLEESDKPE